MMLKQTVWSSPGLCMKSVCFSEKTRVQMRAWVSWMWVCVWHYVSVCVLQIALRSRLTFPLTALNFSQCQDCQREKGRKREVRWEGGGENHVRRLGRRPEFFLFLGGGGLSVHLGAETACMLICFGAARFLSVLPSSPGDVWWRSGLSVGQSPTRGSTQATRLTLPWYVDLCITHTFTQVPVLLVTCSVFHTDDNHPHFLLSTHTVCLGFLYNSTTTGLMTT